MSKDLYAENKRLHQRLEDYITEARRNERKQQRFQTYELRLIGLNSLYELLQNVIYPDKILFNWDIVTLLLLDPEYEIQRFLEEEGVELKDHPTLMFVTNRDDLDFLFPFSLFPIIGPYKPRQHAALFNCLQPPPASIAILPLVRHGKLIGCLNIGSYQPEKFIQGVRTNFFERLAAVIAICIENATIHERLKHQGLTDTLTGVNNRRFFDQRLAEELELAARSKTALSCLLLDVDHFKSINDTYGHQTGDVVLREVAVLIRAQLRGADVLARYGGEEFAALLARINAHEAQEIAERVRNAIAQHTYTQADGSTFQITMSIGIATYQPPAEASPTKPNGELLVGHADKALYEAKSAGRNRVISAGNIDLPKMEEWI